MKARRAVALTLALDALRQELSRGPKGDRGDRGEPGKSVKGDKGDRGDRGDPGKSIKGDRGEPGKSIKGDRGEPGKSIKGDKGDKGDPGKKGDTGPGYDNAKLVKDPNSDTIYTLSLHHTEYGWVEAGKITVPRRKGGGAIGGGVSETRVAEMIEELAMDSGEQEWKTAKATVVNSGETTVLTPASGKRIVIRKVYALNDPAIAIPALIKVMLLDDLGADEWIRNYGILTRQKRTGAVNAPVRIALDVASKVAVTIFYEETD